MAPPGTLLVICPMPQKVAHQLLSNMMPFDLRAQLGRRYFPDHLWHQSASCLYPPSFREPLLEACAAISASSFIIPLDRIRSRRGESGDIHWELFPSMETPEGMHKLIDARCATFATRGIHDAFRNSAHVTTSYWAHSTIRVKRFEPVLWRIDGFALVEVRGAGREYRYETIEAFPLAPTPESPVQQTTLFH